MATEVIRDANTDGQQQSANFEVGEVREVMEAQEMWSKGFRIMPDGKSILEIADKRKEGEARDALNVIRSRAKMPDVTARAVKVVETSMIRAALEKVVTVTAAQTMAEAVHRAYQAAAPGEVVLLSPGCASFDMYPNYARRGDDFKLCVAGLRQEKPT